MKLNLSSSLVASSVWSLVLLTGSTRADFFDYNGLLNDGLDQNIFPRLGQYAVRYTVKDDLPVTPAGCRVAVVNTLERHGARLLTSGAFTTSNATLSKIQSTLTQVDEAKLSPELRFLKSASLLSETDSLVPYGALQAYYSGKSTAEVYPLLAGSAPFVRASGDESLLDDRVILTAKYWRLGFTGGHFPLATLKTSDDVRQAAAHFAKPDVVFSESAGSNNTLDVGTCPDEDKIPDSQGEKGAQQAYAKSTILPTVGARLDARLADAGAADAALTGPDLLNLAQLCSFETLGRASVSNGHLSLAQSGFCGMFNTTEWAILGYAFDVGKWKGAGYGNPYHKALGTGFLRELAARFKGKAPSLEEPTSLNTTIDGQANTFPLPNRLKGPTVYFDGSHDNNMGPIVAAAGLFSGPDLSTSLNAQALPHNWIFSHIAPLQGKVVFEKLTCAGEQDYVRIRANEAILKGWCGNAAPLGQDTLCPMDTFLDKIAFAESSSEWDKCYN